MLELLKPGLLYCLIFCVGLSVEEVRRNYMNVSPGESGVGPGGNDVSRNAGASGQYEQGRIARILIGSPSVTVTTAVVHGLIGSKNVTLECFIDSFPKATNFWMKGDQDRLRSNGKYNITEDSLPHYEFRDRLRLQILDLNDGDLASIFRCVSSNQYGTSTGIIRVIAPEHLMTRQFPHNRTVSIRPGSTFTLECEVNAHPLAVTYWFKSKNDELIIGSQKYRITEERLGPTHYMSRLHINNFGRVDYIVYHCLNKNSYGETQHTFRLTRHESAAKEDKSSNFTSNGNRLSTKAVLLTIYVCLLRN